MKTVRCKTYPEISINVNGKYYEFHNHIGFLPDKVALQLTQTGANSDYEIVDDTPDTKEVSPVLRFNPESWNSKYKRLIWDGPIGYNNGYGKASMMMIEGLSKKLDVHVINSQWEGSVHDHEGETLKKLIEKSEQWTGPLDAFYVKFFPANIITKRLSQRLIAYTMLETTRIPDSWVKILNEYSERCVVPSEHQREAFINSGVKVDVATVPLGLKTELFPVLDRKRNDDVFMFGTMGTLTYRKGTDILVKAFLKAFPRDKYPNVGLFIKTLGIGGITHVWFIEPSILRSDDRIVLATESYSPEELIEKFFQRIDCFVFPTRGEGFGLPPLEAMCTGLPTICTNWSGCAEFLNHDIAYPLDYTMKEVPNGKGGGYPTDLQAEGQMWAEVEVDHLVDNMREVYNNREKAKRKGEKAAKFVRKNFDMTVAAQNLIDYLDSKF